MIEKLLKKAITTYEQELADININIKNLDISKQPIITDMGLAIKELQKICKHDTSHKVDGPYYEGGYLDRSENHYTIVCDNCGKVLESKCIRGAYA